MPEKIDYTAMNDHDLLVMSVMQGNETVKQQEELVRQFKVMNGSVKRNSAWILALKWTAVILVTLCAGTITGGRIGLW